MAKPEASAGKLIELWDWPLRVFHWSLVLSVSTAIATGLLGGSWMPVHAIAGELIAGLLAFRLAWGFFGSSHARFRQFVPGPRRLLAYLKGRWTGVGHNPLGALSVLALLTLLLVQVATGLVGNDDIAFQGPLASLVSEATSHRLTGVHHLLVKVLYGLLALHLAAIAFHLHVKKDNLVSPMVTGKKLVPKETTEPRRYSLAALVSAGLIGLVAALMPGGLAWWSTAHDNTDQPPQPEHATASTTASQATPGW
ncbi:cytochrome b/b6 domain-containing protein [Aquabacterium sp.]|uniref:cytochrome b/b6 domain-containing protein n=1 Tax=Aquabacterium sp. TaxID=1872578 RepID=UPI0035B01223